MTAPKVWDLISNFKDECQTQGWKTSKQEDWILVDGQYHNFLWTRSVHPSTLKKIARAAKCAVREGVSYRVIEVAYTAWLLSEPTPEDVMHTVMNDENLARTTAVYDLSCLHEANPTCLRLNQTQSRVFKEFEEFLQKKWGVKFKSPRDVVTAEV
jgi:hypothetical protein